LRGVRGLGRDEKRIVKGREKTLGDGRRFGGGVGKCRRMRIWSIGQLARNR
jgi:hypothetical protein